MTGTESRTLQKRSRRRSFRNVEGFSSALIGYTLGKSSPYDGDDLASLSGTRGAHRGALRLFKTIREVHQLAKLPKSFTWGARRAMGIADDAWTLIEESGVNPLFYFCHPRALNEQPRLLLYYRKLAALSPQELSALVGGNIKAVETGKVTELDVNWLMKCVVTLNSVLSTVVRAASALDSAHFPEFVFASAGALLQQSWNNAICSEGERNIKTIMVNHLRDEIVQIGWRQGGTTDYTPAEHAKLIDDIGNVRVVRLRQGHHLLFSSEPDISLRDPSEKPLVAVEVKAGTDSAGALERLGAAMKSFENDRNLNPRVKTVYVVRCMTPELRRRIDQYSPFDHTFGLAELLADDKTQKTFANLMLRVILKSKS